MTTATEPIETTSTAAKPAAALEVVDPPAPPAGPTEQEQASAAIVAASEAALANPGMPGRDEFLTLATTARMLCLSGAAPKAVRNNPYVAFHLAMVGRDLGISPSAALELIDVIDGQNGPRLSLSPQLINAQVRRLGLGSIVPAVQTAERCVAVALGPGGKLDVKCKPTYPKHLEGGCGCVNIIGDYEWTWADAQMAELAGIECTPGNHSEKCRNKDSAKRFRCSQGNKTYPKRMHWWRSSGYLADDVYPEAGLGLYTAEELGATVDDEGRAIDVASVDLPDGYEPKQIGGAQAADAAADADERWQLQLRIWALPDTARAELTETWKKSDRVGRVEDLTTATMKIAQAMVAGAESKARTANKDWSPAAGMNVLAGGVVAALLAITGHGALTDPDPAPDGTGEPAPQTAPATERSDEPADTPESPPVPSGGVPRGTAAPEPDESVLEGAEPKLINDVMIEVAALNAHDVDKALTALKLHTEGEIKERRHRLTLAFVRDRKPAQ